MSAAQELAAAPIADEESPPAGASLAVAPAPAEGAPRASVVQWVITGLVVFGPLVALALTASRLWGHAITGRDVVIAGAFYLVTGYGITVGFHRLLTHRSFTAVRPLRIALAVAGSMAFQGGPLSWVANHRLHHVRSDREGDPHSPVAARRTLRAQAGALWHAHAGWLFRSPPAAAARMVRDLRADVDMRRIDRLFPLFCVLSLALPFGIGWLWGRSIGAAFAALLWAGLVRMCVLHHVTWSINSICHRFGRRPFRTTDHSGNVAFLSVVSFGESWHNGHHAFPRSARHGIERGQLDPSAALIRAFEKLGWARDARWPDPTPSTP